MSERELNRIEVLSSVDDGTMTATRAGDLLNLSRRQIQRLVLRLCKEGAGGIRHKARGEPSNNMMNRHKRDYAIELIRDNYADFGPTLATEMLAERHQFKVSRETVRKWMKEEGLWLSRAQRRQFHQPRLRRDCLGELIQIDGSDHHWFEDRSDRCTLLVFIDDATGTLMQLKFVKSESTFSYFAALDGYLADHGRPVAFYSDKHTVFRVAQKDPKNGAGMTQFGRALNELNIEILCANSSQAKGRVERANRTLQDRLVKELRINGISDMDAGNAFLPEFMERYNFKFARVPRRPDNLHRPLNVEPARKADILCLREKRYVGQQLTFSFERKRIMLEQTELAKSLVGKDVDTYVFPDGRFEVRWKGQPLPHSIFDRDQQHVTHAAVTENKRLGEVLSWVKEQQEAQPSPAPKVKSNTEKVAYKPTGKKRGRPTPGWAKTPERMARVEARRKKAAEEKAAQLSIGPH